LILTSFSLGGVFAAIGIRHDRRKWLSAIMGIISGGFLLLILLWKGLM
jgi:hypothetical protein